MNLDLLERDLIRDEGKRSKPYKDTVGVLTIGIGHNLEEGLSEKSISAIFKEDVNNVCVDLEREIPWWKELDDVRQRVLANMCFNLGINRLLSFRKFLDAVQNKKYLQASEEMMNSLWAKQVGIRAARLEHMMMTGMDP